MASFTSQTIASTYKRILTITTEDIPGTTNAKFIRDGDEGTVSCLAIGTAMIGIGTETPGQMLNVHGAEPQVRLSSASNTNIFMEFKPLTATRGFVGWDDSQSAIKLIAGTSFDDAVTGISILTTGKVGIGTGVPDKELHVNKVGNADVGVDDIGGTIALTLEESASTGLVEAGDTLGQIMFGFRDNANLGYGASINAVNMDTTPAASASDRGTDLHFYTCVDSGSGLSKRMTIMNDGGVGIGQTGTDTTHIDYVVPEYGTNGTTFQISGADNATFQLRDRGADTNEQIFAMYNNDMKVFFKALNNDGKVDSTAVGDIMTIKLDDGKVGIGTVSPNAHLDVANPTGATIQLTRSDADNEIAANDVIGQILFVGNDPSGFHTGTFIKAIAEHDWTTDADNKSTSLNFYTQDNTDANNSTTVPKLKIDSGGKVGIGTTAPKFGLEIKGALADNHFALVETGGTSSNCGFEMWAGGDGVTSPTADDGIRLLQCEGGGGLRFQMSTDTYANDGGFSTATMTVGYSTGAANNFVGVGVAAPATKLDVQTTNADGQSDPVFRAIRNRTDNYGATNSIFYFQDDDDEPVAGTGCFGIGDDDDADSFGNLFRVDQGGQMFVPDVYNSTAGVANVSVASGGRITKITSSKRYKDNINYNGVDAGVLYSMKPCSYIEKVTGTEFIGLVAEDMHEIEPRLVEYREFDGKNVPEAIKYDHISAILIKAIQELSAKVTALENNNNQGENSNEQEQEQQAESNSGDSGDSDGESSSESAGEDNGGADGDSSDSSGSVESGSSSSESGASDSPDSQGEDSENAGGIGSDASNDSEGESGGDDSGGE